MERTVAAARHLAILLICLSALPVGAEPPPLVQYQGVVLAPDGSPRGGPIDLQLRIFDAASGGNLLFSETHPATSLVDGVFSVALGAQQGLDPALFAEPGGRWLEVVADGEVLSPRQQILSVPYCLDAATVGGQSPAQLAVAPSPISGFQQQSAGASASVVSANCPAGKAAIGGGCDCAGSTVDSRPVGGGNSWRCECSSSEFNRAWVLCADATGVCGNGVVEGDEVCDGSQVSNCPSGTCAQNCVCGGELCGDGVVGPTEACDDGNASNLDDCLTGCALASCGDGFVDGEGPEVEQCDTAGATAGCDADCTVAYCGDGTQNPLAGEQCDTFGMTASCDPDCTIPFCGDGLPNPAAGEQCDAGGVSATCDADCTVAFCGDGTLNPLRDEHCDDGNSSNGDDCTSACRNAICGDGFLDQQPPVIEQCDDGNNFSGDGCSAQCLSE